MRILSASGDARPSSPAGAAPIGDEVDSRRAGDGVLRGAARRDEPHPGPLSRRAVDLEAAAEQRQPLADAEQPPAHLAGLRSIVESRRFEPDPLIRHGDAQLIVGVERQLQGDPIRLRVLDRVEEELSDRLEEQRADVLPRGIGPRIGDDLDTSACTCRASSSPATSAPPEGRTAAAREETARSSAIARRRSLRRAGASPRKQLARRGAALAVALQLLFEIQRRR